MLQRKLLLVLGSLVLLLLLTAFTSIMLLNAVLSDLDDISAEGFAGIARTSALGTTVTEVEAELNQLRLDEETHLDDLIEAIHRLETQAFTLEAPPAARSDARRLRELLPSFAHHVGDVATAGDPETVRVHTEEALAATVAIRAAIASIGRAFQERTDAVHSRVTTRFRWLVLGLGLVFLLVINVSIVVLLRAASMVIRPVNQLLDASRRLAREEFDHRLRLDRRDEFGELARAYDHLAEQLQLNEQRKIETLHQVARTLNHELNNAISIIELQLQLVARRGKGEPESEARLRQIHETLAGMSETIEALKHVRRIVLTDYVAGVKMLDLPRSVEEEPTSNAAAIVSGTETRSS